MGVMRLPKVGQRNQNEQNWNVDNIIQEIQNRNDHNSLSDEEIERLERVERNRNRRRMQTRNTQVRPENAFRALGCRGKSHKKHRRYENANMIAFDNDFDSDEIFGDITINDFVQSNVSAFTSLLMEKDKMNIWNDFINSEENEQQYFLQNCSEDEFDDEDDYGVHFGKNKNKNKKRLSSTGSDDNDDDEKRDKHPAFSPKRSFDRIDNDLKSLLRRRQIPLGILERIEENLIEFFEQNPKDYYECCLSNSYQRLLLHACSQYLDLICRSFNKDGLRWSKVGNSKNSFIKPTQMLTQFISEIKKKS